MTQWVGLLYSVILTPTRRVSKADLTLLAQSLGFSAVKTVLSTGNLIFGAEGVEAGLTDLIEARIAESWGRPIPVLLRNAADFRAMVAANPFPEASRLAPAQVAVRVMRQAPAAAELARLQSLSSAEAVFAARERALWVATSTRLSTAPLLRAMGAARMGIGTFRNASALAKIAAALD